MTKRNPALKEPRLRKPIISHRAGVGLPNDYITFTRVEKEYLLRALQFYQAQVEPNAWTLKRPQTKDEFLVVSLIRQLTVNLQGKR